MSLRELESRTHALAGGETSQRRRFVCRSSARRFVCRVSGVSLACLAGRPAGRLRLRLLGRTGRRDTAKTLTYRLSRVSWLFSSHTPLGKRRLEPARRRPTTGPGRRVRACVTGATRHGTGLKKRHTADNDYRLRQLADLLRDKNLHSNATPARPELGRTLVGRATHDQSLWPAVLQAPLRHTRTHERERRKVSTESRQLARSRARLVS